MAHFYSSSPKSAKPP